MMMMMMTMMFLVLVFAGQQLNAFRTVDGGFSVGNHIVHKAFQAGAGKDHHLGAFNTANLRNVQRIVMKTRYVFGHQSGNRNAGAFA